MFMKLKVGMEVCPRHLYPWPALEKINEKLSYKQSLATHKNFRTSWPGTYQETEGNYHKP